MHSGAWNGGVATAGPPDACADRRGETSLAGRLDAARQRGFVGRSEVLERFRLGLDGPSGARPVLLLHGPAGIGKTALLDRLAVLATERGRPVLRVDPAVTTGPGDADPASVVLVDDLDAAPDLQVHLRERVLPGLSSRAVVVAAGRDRPAPEWYADPGWRALVEVRHLGPLSEAEARELLTARDVAPRHQRDLVDFATGNPLALGLAADDAAAGSDPSRRWTPSRLLVSTLLDHLVDPAPSTSHDVALRVGAHVRHTTVDLLRTVLDDELAAHTFDWLGARSYVEAGDRGLRVDDLVARLVDSDHRWRDPGGYETAHRSLWRHLASRLEDTGPDTPVVAATETAGDLLHLQRYRHLERHGTRGVPRRAEETTYDGEVAPAVRALAAAHLGPVGRARVDHWLEHEPDAFTVLAIDGRPTSFVTWLRLVEPPAGGVEADPVAATAWDRATGSGPSTGADEVGLVRFLVPRPRAPHLAADDPRAAHCLGLVAERRGGLASTWVALPDPEPCAGVMASFDHHLRDRVEECDGSAWGLFEHDWRDVGLTDHLRRTEPPVGVEPTAPVEAPGWSRGSFDLAVREALRSFTDADALAASALVRAGVGAHLDPADPVAALRECLRSAVDRLAEDPRLTKAHRAVRATHLQRATTQEATASRLQMAFSTYRRHLAKGTALVCDRMWSQHQGGVG